MATTQDARVLSETIEGLNRRALELRAEGISVKDALTLAGYEFGFDQLVKRSDDAMVVENAQGVRVNCWLEGPQSQELQDGGAGYDDNTEWADEDGDGDGEND